ncbi:MAG: hypothetical protein ACEQSB_01615 [Undibacterium sp.]
MQKIPKALVLIALVLVLTVVVYYREAISIFRSMKSEMIPAPDTAVDKREVSAVVSYVLEEGSTIHELRFTLKLDTDGAITDVVLVENTTNTISAKQAEFAEGLLKVIKGKKLSELGPVDKIGTSSYTTAAFNRALDQMKSQRR